MKITSFWAASVSLAHASAVLAQGLRQATGGPEATAPPATWYPTPTPEVSACKASLITTLCEYKKPELAIASSGKAHCWEYCNEHQPCSFVIFVAGNPYTGSGTCWLYPGETFDKTAGSTGCDYLSVYDKPDCGTPTPTAGGCEATASPSAIATVCGYPTPDDDCFYGCTASDGASDCLSQCAKRDSCTYAVFNPHNEKNSPYDRGTCWMYPSGTYDPTKAKTCSGAPEQFVYENKCPKPPQPSSSGSQPPAAASPPSGESSPSPTGSSTGAKAEGVSEGNNAAKTGASGSASVSVSLIAPLAAGLAVLMWQGLR